MTRRIAMWSGPRNISTALMRSWENRADTAVSDEPFYACYLEATGAPHPGAEAIRAAGETDWRAVVARLLGPAPDGAVLYYQKHMAHHLLPDISREWLDDCEHAFLIRDPREMLISLAKVLPDPRLEDTGLPQQVELFERMRRSRGTPPPVLDAREVLQDPRGMLGALCEALEVPFDEAMLAWPPGPRASDGPWAPYWYAAVEASTGFAPWRPREEPLPAGLEPLLSACAPLYERLGAQRLRP